MRRVDFHAVETKVMTNLLQPPSARWAVHSMTGTEYVRLAAESRFRSPSRVVRALFLVTTAALVLRIVGIAFGSPASVHPDESQYMPTALGLLSDRSLVPSDYHNSHLLTNICLMLVGL